MLVSTRNTRWEPLHFYLSSRCSLNRPDQKLGSPNTLETEDVTCLLLYLRKMHFSYVSLLIILMYTKITKNVYVYTHTFPVSKEVRSTVDIRKDLPDLDCGRRHRPLTGISELLIVPLGRSGRDFIFFCRKSRIEVSSHYRSFPLISSSTLM